MNDQSIVNKHEAAGHFRKKSRPRGNWQLMIFDQYGQTVQINNLRRNLMILAVFVTVLLLVTLCFAALFFHERSMRQELQSSLIQIQEKAGSLMDENDALMARLAVLYDQEVSSGENPAEDREEENGVPGVTPVDKTIGTAATPSVAGPVINFEDFRFSRRPDLNTVDVAFLLKKLDATQTRATGHVFVVLKGETDRGGRRLVIPDAMLTDDRPQPPDRGQYFSIERFKKIEMSAQTERPEEFDQATVLAYAPDGQLLKEVVFPVSLTEPDEEEEM